jgi:hypothetical protein
MTAVKRDLDLQRLLDIPDPFEDAARSVPPTVAPDRRPPSPSRSRVRALRASALGAAVAYDAGWLAFFRVHGGGRSTTAVVVGATIPLVAGGLAWSAAMRRGARGLGPAVGRIVGLTTSAVGLFALATLILSPANADTSASFWQGAATCLMRSLIFVAGPLVLAALAFRHSFATASTLKSSALAVACGALAAVMMNFVCPDNAGFHVLVGHGAVMVLAGGLGALVGRSVAQA